MRLPQFLSEEDAAAYAKAGHGGPSGFGQWPAIVVVDFTNGFVDPAYSLANGDAGQLAVRQTRRVLDAARAVGVPVVFTRPTLDVLVNPAAGTISLKRIGAVQEALRQPGANELAPDLGRRPDELIVEKSAASGFFGTDLVKVLTYNRVDTVIIAGATTSGCVRATVVDAASYNYFVVVPEECVSDRSVPIHEMTLWDMEMKYTDVLPIDDVLDYLAGLSSPSKAASAVRTERMLVDPIPG
jgi:nicotinamidase-related amidase